MQRICDKFMLASLHSGKFSEIEGEKVNQISKINCRSVAEGIEHFKGGRHIEAFQCLNKALTIDPQNVEGLVARGALYANSGSFQKAIYDFEAALKLNLNHSNAKKYLGETLLALGRSFEDENKFEEARKAYVDCLKVNPQHQEALASLEYVKTKLGMNKKIVEPSELELPRKFCHYSWVKMFSNLFMTFSIQYRFHSNDERFKVCQRLSAGAKIKG